jgi:hypothetical protein
MKMKCCEYGPWPFRKDSLICLSVHLSICPSVHLSIVFEDSSVTQKKRFCNFDSRMIPRLTRAGPPPTTTSLPTRFNSPIRFSAAPCPDLPVSRRRDRLNKKLSAGTGTTMEGAATKFRSMMMEVIRGQCYKTFYNFS